MLVRPRLGIARLVGAAGLPWCGMPSESLTLVRLVRYGFRRWSRVGNTEVSLPAVCGQLEWERFGMRPTSDCRSEGKDDEVEQAEVRECGT